MQEDPYQLYISQSINVKNVCMNVTKKSKHQENKQPSLKPHIKLNREFSRDETEMAEKQSGVGTGEGELSNPSLLLAGVSSPVHTVEISEVLRAPPKAENRSTSRSSCSTLSISPRTLASYNHETGSCSVTVLYAEQSGIQNSLLSIS